MKVIGFTGDEIQTVYKILATILHLVIFHRRDPSLVLPSPPTASEFVELIDSQLFIQQ